MRIIRCELLKLISNRLGIIALFAPLVMVSLLTWLLTKSPSGMGNIQQAMLKALQLSQIFAVIVGASITGQEYTESALRTSLLAVPQRTHLFWGKTTLVVGAVSFSYLLSIGTAILIFTPNLTANTIVAAGSSWLGLALLAAFLATASRSIITPLATMLPLILGLSMIIHAITPLARFLPDLATITIFIGSHPQLLSREFGSIILATWVITAGITAYTILTRSDVR